PRMVTCFFRSLAFGTSHAILTGCTLVTLSAAEQPSLRVTSSRMRPGCTRLERRCSLKRRACVTLAAALLFLGTASAQGWMVNITVDEHGNGTFANTLPRTLAEHRWRLPASRLTSEERAAVRERSGSIRTKSMGSTPESAYLVLLLAGLLAPL